MVLQVVPIVLQLFEMAAQVCCNGFYISTLVKPLATVAKSFETTQTLEHALQVPVTLKPDYIYVYMYVLCGFFSGVWNSSKHGCKVFAIYLLISGPCLDRSN